MSGLSSVITSEGSKQSNGQWLYSVYLPVLLTTPLKLQLLVPTYSLTSSFTLHIGGLLSLCEYIILDINDTSPMPGISPIDVDKDTIHTEFPKENAF